MPLAFRQRLFMGDGLLGLMAYRHAVWLKLKSQGNDDWSIAQGIYHRHLEVLRHSLIYAGEDCAIECGEVLRRSEFLPKQLVVLRLCEQTGLTYFASNSRIKGFWFAIAHALPWLCKKEPGCWLTDTKQLLEFVLAADKLRAPWKNSWAPMCMLLPELTSWRQRVSDPGDARHAASKPDVARRRVLRKTGNLEWTEHGSQGPVPTLPLRCNLREA